MGALSVFGWEVTSSNVCWSWHRQTPTSRLPRCFRLRLAVLCRQCLLLPIQRAAWIRLLRAPHWCSVPSLHRGFFVVPFRSLINIMQSKTASGVPEETVSEHPHFRYLPGHRLLPHSSLQRSLFAGAVNCASTGAIADGTALVIRSTRFVFAIGAGGVTNAGTCGLPTPACSRAVSTMSIALEKSVQARRLACLGCTMLFPFFDLLPAV